MLHQEWYSYDAANNLLTKLVNSVATSYTYDQIDQLKTENQVGGGLANTYNYDYNGNRLSRISATGTDIYHYDDADKLMSVTRGAATTSYTYDSCGRPTQIGGRTLTWDYEGRLTNVNGGGVPSTNYGYNGLGSRVAKSGSNSVRTYKRDGVGVTAPVLADGVTTMVPGISEKTGGVTNFMHTDRMGSMKGISNSGTVTDTAEFDAFGKVVARTGTSATQKGFASEFGYQEDGESGYKLLGHRYYDPETGRFLSRDPIYDGRNWYGYCRNNPLKYTDQSGLTLHQVNEKDTPDEYNAIMGVALEMQNSPNKADKERGKLLETMLKDGDVFVEDSPSGIKAKDSNGNEFDVAAEIVEFGTWRDGPHKGKPKPKLYISGIFLKKFLKKSALSDIVGLLVLMVHEMQHVLEFYDEQGNADEKAIRRKQEWSACDAAIDYCQRQMDAIIGKPDLRALFQSAQDSQKRYKKRW